MLERKNLILLFCLLFCVLGCAQITETAKVIWGSSTRALENARADAITKTYRCSFDDCYDAVLSFARDKETRAQEVRDEETRAQEIDRVETDSDDEEVQKNYFNIFINDRKKGHIVVMGIEGNVGTTEAGIFFSQPSLTTVKIEVTSLSESAKRKVAQIVFDEMDSRFSGPQ